MNIRDLAERVLWTGVAAAVTALGQIQFDLGAVWTPIATAAVTAVLVWLRRQVPVLPNPGSGLPGLPTAKTG